MPDVRFLALRLEAPLMTFGAPAVDQRRPVQRWPARSMLTGLLANALGWQRHEGDRLNRLQARLLWAARLEREGTLFTEFQTAQLAKDDRAWTTRGRPEGRDGGADSYKSPHLRYKDHRADALVHVVLGLAEAAEAPSLNQVNEALYKPARPLFFGRKACMPATPIAAGWVTGADPLQALLAQNGAGPVFFGAGAGDPALARLRHRASDERRFDLDVHAGQQWVYELGPLA
jgi:CRISPR system Cascade subunit CasD